MRSYAVQPLAAARVIRPGGLVALLAARLHQLLLLFDRQTRCCNPIVCMQAMLFRWMPEQLRRGLTVAQVQAALRKRGAGAKWEADACAKQM